jgi:5-(carboxyamino)imidazole ribonucleotide mutase
MVNPLVSIIMGSDSDLPVMNQAAEILNEFGVPVATVALNGAQAIIFADIYTIIKQKRNIHRNYCGSAICTRCLVDPDSTKA